LIIQAQGCKVLRQQGYKMILVNNNPATIMTDLKWPAKPILADHAGDYRRVSPRPDGLLPHGEPVGLDAAVASCRGSVLKKYGVRMIGANLHTIKS
jgi:carbamoyl-phosphate synthase large subunit